MIEGGRAALDQVRQSRVAAADMARSLGLADIADDVELVTAELVTNAVLHGGGLDRFHVKILTAGVRVEVTDRNPSSPVLSGGDEEAATGHGLLLVGHLARRWGIDPTDDGKVVWAEVTGDAGTGPPEVGDTSGANGHTAPTSTVRVDLGDVPTDLVVEASAHVDTLLRELTLISVGDEPISPQLARLVDSVGLTFAAGRHRMKELAAQAQTLGNDFVQLDLELPAGTADDALAHLSALDELDSYCRAQRLTTLATPPRHRLFRDWYVHEVVAQLDAAAKGEPPPPPTRFEDRLLDEVERVAEAQRIADRTARLYTVARALNVADTPEAVADAVLHEGVAALGASAGGLLLASTPDRLQLPGAVGYDDEVVSRLRSESPNAELPAAVALRTGEPIWLETRSDRDRRFPELIGFEPRTTAVCAVPLVVQGRRLGALRFSFNDTRLFDDGEREFVLALADQTAQALARAQLQAERIDVSRRLQQSLLPPELPEIPRVSVAARYHPFGEGVEVGGDFYDIWALGPNRWALAVGDATGTGPEAAALTALVRHSLRALTMTEHDPAEVLRRLNSLLMTNGLGFERFCTAVFGVVTVDETISVDLANAGHPYPWLRHPDGNVEELEVDGALLGVFDEPEFSCIHLTIEPGAQLVLFTDGVLEARRADDFFSTDGVARVLTSAPAGAEESAAMLEQAVLDHIGGRPTDDMAIIVIEAEPVDTPAVVG